MEKWSRGRLSLAVVVAEISFTGLIITSRERPCDGRAKLTRLRIREISRKWNFAETCGWKIANGFSDRNETFIVIQNVPEESDEFSRLCSFESDTNEFERRRLELLEKY